MPFPLLPKTRPTSDDVLMTETDANFKAMNDDELAADANLGLRGQGATVEMMRRLREAMIQAEQSTSALNNRMLGYTRAMLALAILQALLVLAQMM